MRRTAIFSLFVSIVLSPLYGQDSSFPTIAGWETVPEKTVYNSENLWDAINGAAELFLLYDFVDLRTARYTRGDSIEVSVELYRHRSASDAFGIYSQERHPGYNFIQLGVQGYLQEGVLNFLSGVYYVKISTLEVGDAAQNALLMIGRKVEKHLGQESAWPEIIRRFPAAGRLPNTEQYVAKSFLGYSFLNGAYIVSYDDGALFRMFVIAAETQGHAKEMAEAYCNAVPKDSVKRLDGGRYELRDSHYGVVALAVTKGYLCGIVGSSVGSREQYLRRLSNAFLK